MVENRRTELSRLGIVPVPVRVTTRPPLLCQPCALVSPSRPVPDRPDTKGEARR
ncbi:hypothetical protein ACFXKW_13130 [Streptomyces sp. NPDC059193]|uniref:hypothetical protein n=1 Tax=Streptomyces sp. NPDC059193 TaxID=3346763 RepID=UPI0036B7D73E